MRNLLAFLAAAVVAFALVGWWLDWYRFRSAPSPDGKPSVTVDFNPAKISEDFNKAKAAVETKLAEQKAKLEADRKAAEAKKADPKAEEKSDLKADAPFSDWEEAEVAPPPPPAKKRRR